MIQHAADEALERAHRVSFGRLVGWLFRVTGDLQLAEDSVATAFATALSTWRTSGVPDSPEAWLRVVARNHARSVLKRDNRMIAVPPEDFAELAQPTATGGVDGHIDDRLALMFVCAHPAIDRRMHAPLMLQAVLGVDAARIATVFLVPAATMGQRLSRAKTKIRHAGTRFRRPETDESASRLNSVLQAVYAAYGLADPIADLADDRNAALREESLRLARLLTELLPTEPETWGLNALLLHTESRRPARVVNGRFIPLMDQDTTLWTPAIRDRADDSLRHASALGRSGRFQLEAAISAIHSSRARNSSTDWESIALLYRGLLRIAPTVGATVGAASALIEIGQTREASELLSALPQEFVRDHQPYWVCRARLARAVGDSSGERTALDNAIGLTSDPVVRAYLLRQRPG
ncbi:RNA polymerase sigma factor [Microbacterium lacus]|uniref:RNA polymerase sigma factor n=1 Tax=Microbacterium lacus TaxID=415217 RepID=UPI0012FE0B3A|nr:DUF6596 domain-containing protein [Microbacterium lacus]